MCTLFSANITLGETSTTVVVFRLLSSEWSSRFEGQAQTEPSLVEWISGEQPAITGRCYLYLNSLKTDKPTLELFIITNRNASH